MNYADVPLHVSKLQSLCQADASGGHDCEQYLGAAIVPHFRNGFCLHVRNCIHPSINAAKYFKNLKID